MKSRVGYNLAFLDMVFNLTLVFAFLFLMSFLLVRPADPAKKTAVEMKAEFVIQMAWPDGTLDDMDLWLLMPDGKRIGYSYKDAGTATLDHDDRGGYGNVYRDPKTNEKKLQTIRREILTIRAILPGRYVVNVHCFAAHNDWDDFKSPSPLPYNVEATLVKLNPQYVDVAKNKVMMHELNEQHTLFAFTVGEDGRIVSVETNVDEPFVVISNGYGQ